MPHNRQNFIKWRTKQISFQFPSIRLLSCIYVWRWVECNIKQKHQPSEIILKSTFLLFSCHFISLIEYLYAAQRLFAGSVELPKWLWEGAEHVSGLALCLRGLHVGFNMMRYDLIWGSDIWLNLVNCRLIQVSLLHGIARFFQSPTCYSQSFMFVFVYPQKLLGTTDENKRQKVPSKHGPTAEKEHKKLSLI